jgi:CTP:molybdopterin cytidylyltransferase MocA
MVAPMDPSYDAIVLAGDRRDSHTVFGENKAFLEIEGVPLLVHVLAALDRAPSIRRAFVVGDPDRLDEVLARAGEKGLRLPVTVVPQEEDLWANFWAGFVRTLSHDTRDRIASGERPEDAAPPEERNRRVLALSGDIPLVQPAEIETFLAAAAVSGADYAAGITSEETLEPFYSTPGCPGIRMAYFQLREGRFRQNNLHLARPLRVAHRERIERMYRHRYQRNVGDAARLALAILKTRAVGLKILWGFLLLHLAMKLDLAGWRRTSDFLRRFLLAARVEWAISRMLGCDFRLIQVPSPGAALDVDRESDFETLRARYAEWRARLASGSPSHMERRYAPAS